MNWKIILSVIQVIASILIIGIVLMQSGKSSGLSGAIAGGAETFFGKNKGRTIDAILNRYTSIFALVFVTVSVALFIITNK